MASGGPDESSAATRRLPQDGPNAAGVLQRPGILVYPIASGWDVRGGILERPGPWVHLIFNGWDLDLAEIEL